MRVLDTSNSNEVKFFDKRSSTILTVFMRYPNTKERVNYLANLYKKIGDEVAIDVEFKVDEGIKLITGIAENNFCDVQGKPISSNPESENYNPDWKTIIRDTADDICWAVSDVGYENLSVLPVSGGNAQLPFQKSSNDTSGGDAAAQEKKLV